MPVRHRAVGAAIAVEDMADPRHRLFAEGGHRAQDHVVGHRTQLEDHRQAREVELALMGARPFDYRFGGSAGVARGPSAMGPKI